MMGPFKKESLCFAFAAIPRHCLYENASQIFMIIHVGSRSMI